ncbi:hypothetical protein ACFQZE_23390 [Paenibacillus sp. GCM10027627]|uniref:hypothetical protein n=1 Tax=unclassified Paenibacillus TaxID=185978 RepID=UPI003644C8D8
MRYRAGWLQEKLLLALTHFEPVVTAEDFSNIATDTKTALREVTGPFHLLIDNRIIKETSIASLDTMLESLPLLRHPQLRWIIVVLPAAIKENAAGMDIQRQGLIRLKHVDRLSAAFSFLASEDSRLKGKLDYAAFFENS